MALRQGSIETKNKILSVCVRLFLERGYKNTPISMIIEEADVSVSTFQNIFHTKDGVLAELIEFMFSNRFAMAEKISENALSPIYVYAVETAIQLALTELNENLRDIYCEAYSLPDTAKLTQTTTANLRILKKLKQQQRKRATLSTGTVKSAVHRSKTLPVRKGQKKRLSPNSTSLNLPATNL